MKPPRVVIVVLNWNKPDDTIECVSSCLEVDYDNFETIIVDNHSDHPVDVFTTKFPGIRVLRNSENLGFTGGNNAGIAEALSRGADYVFMLNNDIVVEKSVLKELLKAVETRPDAGIVGPKVLYYDDRRLINSMGTSINWFRSRPEAGFYNRPDEGISGELRESDVIHGCALLVSADFIRKTGVFDEKFFIFHEETDWCFRSLRAGRKNIVVPSARVYHKESKTMREFSLLTHYYSTRNFLYMSRKNAGFADLAKSRAGFVYLLLKNAFLWAAGGEKKKKLAAAFFAGAADYFTGRMGKCRRVFH
jgi:GT2 family glycosyltransferase